MCVGASLRVVYPTLFANVAGGDAVSFTQEFGTVSGLAVLHSLVQENACWHHCGPGDASVVDTVRRLSHAAFNPPGAEYAAATMDRGVTVLDQAVAALSGGETGL